MVFNLWGGIPGAMRGSACASARFWLSCAGTTDAILPCLSDNAGTRFHACVDEGGEALFKQAQRAGWRVVVFGPTGFAWPPPRCSEEAFLYDPASALSGSGIDFCDVRDDGAWRGRSSSHDEATLRKAQRALDAAASSNTPTLLWVNLLACRDTTRVRFRPDERCSEDACTGHAARAYDRRRVPPSVDTSLPNPLRDALGSTASRARDAGAEYAALLATAESDFHNVCAMVEPLARRARAHGASVAMTATHTFSLGEHGTRTGAAPTAACARTFFACTTGAAVAELAQPVYELISHFVLRTTSLHVSRLPAVCSVGVAPTCVYAYVTCRLRDHVYACVYAHCGVPPDPNALCEPESLLAVYDLGTDVDECVNVLPYLTHLHADFGDMCKAALARHPTPIVPVVAPRDVLASAPTRPLVPPLPKPTATLATAANAATANAAKANAEAATAIASPVTASALTHVSVPVSPFTPMAQSDAMDRTARKPPAPSLLKALQRSTQSRSTRTGIRGDVRHKEARLNASHR